MGRTLRRSTLGAIALLTLVCARPRVLAQIQPDIKPPALHDLRGISELKTAFDQDTDKIRLVLLLSPT
jgi:hypothetical protein